MQPGDSLVDKMFEEGIKNADAFIIVLSCISVTKKWVKEELNASAVKRINSGSKIIPVIIENCEIPEVLKSTVWTKINNLQVDDQLIQLVVSSILGINQKPELGELPQYAKKVIDVLPGLNIADSIVFKLICDEAMKSQDFWMTPDNLIEGIKKFDINEDQLFQSLEILESEYFIKGTKNEAGYIMFFEITTFGFDKYVRKFISEYDEKTTTIIALIVNKNIYSGEKLAEDSQIEIVLVNHILNMLESNGYLKLISTESGSLIIAEVSPKLKRILDK